MSIDSKPSIEKGESWDMESHESNNDDHRNLLRKKMMERENTLTKSEMSFLETILLDDDIDRITNAMKTLSNDEWFVSPKDKSTNVGSMKRLLFLKKRSQCEITKKLWKAHEGGLRISSSSSKKSILNRGVLSSSRFQNLTQSSKTLLRAYDDTVFRPNPPLISSRSFRKVSFNEFNDDSEKAERSIPTIGPARRLRSESMVSVLSNSSDNGFLPPKAPVITPISTTSESNLPAIRHRSSSSQNILPLLQHPRKRQLSIRKRVMLRSSSRGDEIEMSLQPTKPQIISNTQRSSSTTSLASLASVKSQKRLLKRSLSRSSSISSMNSSYMPSSYDDHELLARSFVLHPAMRQNSSDILSSLNHPLDLGETEIDGDESYSWYEDLDNDYDAWNNQDFAPFQILGTNIHEESTKPHVLSPPLMESLQHFVPYELCESNYWLKYSLVRDGSSLHTLLQHVRSSKNTFIAIETVDGEVFGSFTSRHWKKSMSYYGNGESFLWRMRRPRTTKCQSIIDQAHMESELDVYPVGT